MPQGQLDPEKKKLGIIIYTSPTTSQFWFGLGIAKQALAKGYGVHLFAWGDAEFALVDSDAAGDYSRAFRELSSMLTSKDFILDACTSCFKSRGLPSEKVIAGAHMSGLHKIPEMIKTCHKTLAMIP
ncbi:MAG: DsrE family protein [Nitrososphaerota archaeon]|nr:DsrE family protein [Nitrososphaerota archaeon]